MRNVQDTTRSASDSQSSFQDRDFTAAFTGQEAYKEIIKKAETVSLVKLFKYYHIRIDQFNRKCACPFIKHKGGRESTPSFYFYPETNTFWCFGCKTGSTPVDLVASMENCNKPQAALKILNSFSDGLENYLPDANGKDTYQEKLNIIFSFSSLVRDKIAKNPDNLTKIEEICCSFDKMNDKYELDFDALKFLIDKISVKLEEI